MKRIIEVFKEQGGINLLKNYLKNGSLLAIICELLFLGKNKTALEIIRLSDHLKVKEKLHRHYKKELQKFDASFNRDLTNNSSNKVWICWFQGIENAPYVVQKCYESVKSNLNNKEIVLITEKNMKQYVDFPEYIIQKWKKGIITNTHMTDLLRLELLTKYGGLWLDATVYCSSNKIPDYIFNSDLFFYQILKPGKNGHSNLVSSWLLSSKSNNKVLLATKHLCYEYWKKNNSMVDYFLLHYFMTIVLEYYKEDLEKVIPVSNSTPHVLLLRLFEQYDENLWNELKKQTCFHKLSYKFTDDKISLKNTYYEKIISNAD